MNTISVDTVIAGGAESNAANLYVDLGLKDGRVVRLTMPYETADQNILKLIASLGVCHSERAKRGLSVIRGAPVSSIKTSYHQTESCIRLALVYQLPPGRVEWPALLSVPQARSLAAGLLKDCERYESPGKA